MASMTRSASVTSAVVSTFTTPLILATISAGRLGVHLALLHGLAEALVDDPEAALDELVVDVAEHDVVARLGHHLGDAGTHGAGAHYYDLLHVAATAATS